MRLEPYLRLSADCHNTVQLVPVTDFMAKQTVSSPVLPSTLDYTHTHTHTHAHTHAHTQTEAGSKTTTN